jgi:primosomal protein N' (replication factor Y)
MTLYADVVLPVPLDQSYTYSIPEDLERAVRIGSRALVPLGNRWLTGVVVALKKTKPEKAIKVKPIADVLDETPLFTPPLLSFTRRLGRSFLIPWGEVLQLAAPPSFLVRSKTSVILTSKGKEALETGLLSEEERQLAVLLGAKSHSPLFLERKSGLKNASVLLSRMRKKDLVSLEKSVRQVRRRAKPEIVSGPAQLELDFSLDENAWRAAATISGAMTKKAFSPFLLVGPAGRRKAVYSYLLKEAASLSGRVLFIVPEISLTSSMVEEFKKSLGDGLAVLHSQLTDKQRELEWQKIRESRSRVVIGPRSALFSPLENLRLIILDEEQDESYSPQEGLPFDVRMGARIRAEEEGAVLLMGSSAPTVESFFRARKGRFLVELGRDSLRSKVSLLDFRGRSGLLDSRLVRAVRERLDKHEQAVLFYNRRGYSSQLACGRCGFVPGCDRCDLPLAYHKSEGKLVCHACRRSFPTEMNCPRCRGRLTVRMSAGIEAVAEDLKRTFPRNRIELFTADEAGRKEKRKALLGGFERGEIDILVGTQFLAHQATLPPVALVAVLHPEMVLHLADFRSGQKTFQAISRAMGFLREGKGAEAFVQTSAPDHYSIREAARGNYEAFYEQEIRFRRLLDYPPFSSLAEIVFSGGNRRQVAAAARALAARVSDSDEDIQVFGPSLAPLSRRRGLYRIQISLKSKKLEPLKDTLRSCLKGIRTKKTLLLFP